MIGSENLKKRIISAIVMILIVLPLIVFGGLYLKIGTVVLGACSMYELLKQKNNMPLFIKIISIISVMLVIYFSIKKINILCFLKLGLSVCAYRRSRSHCCLCRRRSYRSFYQTRGCRHRSFFRQVCPLQA